MSMITTGTKTVPTGTAESIVASSTPCISVRLQNAAVDSNAAVIYIGGSAAQDFALAVGGEVEVFVRDAADIYCISDAGSETLRYLIITG